MHHMEPIDNTVADESHALDEARALLLRLFHKSVLKQAKLKNILEAIGHIDGDCRYLDLGSDNGIISYLLRQRGGTWWSGDLTPDVVAAISRVVGSDTVSLVSGDSLPYEDAYFDAVVVVDMLEHVSDHNQFIAELYRVLKPGGRLVINAPNIKRYSLLRLLRNAIGQTDEAHGHLRAGYSLQGIEDVAAGYFAIENSKTYSRFFAEAIDTAIVWAYGLISGRGSKHVEEGEISKGLVITATELGKFRKKFRLFSAIYPLVWLLSRFDVLMLPFEGYMRISVLRRLPMAEIRWLKSDG